MTRSGVVAIVAMLTVLLGAAPAGAAQSSSRTVDRLERFWTTTYKKAPKARAALAANEVPSDLLAKASPDECYGGVGASFAAIGADGTCGAGRSPKVNQAYVWGLTKAGDDLWFGTAPNVLCLVMGGYLGTTTATSNDSYTCEFGQSGFKQMFAALPDAIGDWRPSQLLRHSVKTGKLEDVGAQLTGADRTRLTMTLGIRSAGSLGRLVLFAGPNLALGGGLNLFAFDTQTGKFVASTTLPGYSNIRRWIVAGGELYTAVGKTGGGGALLRWNGNPDDIGAAGAPAGDLFDLDEVGTLPNEGADLAEHEGRIYVSTWPSFAGFGGTPAGVYRSEPLGAGGLPDSTAAMDEVWSVGDYEPDPVVAATYGGGALASFDGRLVWGTMHVPMLATLANLRAYEASDYGGAPDPADIAAAALGTWRAVAIFSGDELGEPGEDVDLLYGNSVLPAFTSGSGWSLQPTGYTPELGAAGFDDIFNNYTWAMGVTDRGLYVGTMDHSYLINKAIQPLLQTLGMSEEESKLSLPAGMPGADLMRFTDLDDRALTMSRAGVGNYTNYGVRTMVAEPERLYLGTANPMNLMTSKTDDVPEGGWELVRVGPKQAFPADPPPAPQVVTVTQVVNGPVQATSQSRSCTPRRRKQFTLRLGLRLNEASRSRMLNVRKVTATVGGKKLKTKRGKTGVEVSVDLRQAKGQYASVKVVLELKKAVRAESKGKVKRTKRLTRTYRYTVCG